MSIEEPASSDFKPTVKEYIDLSTNSTSDLSINCSTSDLSPNEFTEDEALLQLRHKELMAYHHLCVAFRAQGHLTPEKLSLLKEVGEVLYIPEERHAAECNVVACTKELIDIAEWVAGPGTEVEWLEEVVDLPPPPNLAPVDPENLKYADAVAAAYQKALEKMRKKNDQCGSPRTIKVKYPNNNDAVPEDESDSENEDEIDSLDKKDEGKTSKTEVEVKEEAKDDDTSSSLSSASDDYQMQLEEETKPEVKKTEISKEELDATLMPPPPPVLVISSPLHVSRLPSPSTSISTPAVITIPPPTDRVAPASTIAVSESIRSLEIAAAPVASPALTEEEAKARADFLSSLPPLVVVPPPDPAETSALSAASTSPRSPSMVLSPGMSFQMREDSKKRKRSLSLTQEATAGLATAAKTVALSSYSKMTPVMVTAATGSGGQVKVTPIVSRSKMTTTPQAQKVIIVSNSPTCSTSMMKRSLNVPMGSIGLPMIRGNQPRFQPVTAQNPGGVMRPKMVTVPAKCRAKGSNMVNLQLKNTITLNQDNVTVVDTNLKRLPGPTKILPKPSGSMFIVNAGQGSHKLATAVGGKDKGKQNIVIIQKGANQRTLTLSNTNKDLMQKLMSKKCVMIQSSKMVPKNTSPKPKQQLPLATSTPKPQPQPQLHQSPPVMSTSSNTVVVDLSQEQYRQNLGETTVRDILQAAGIVCQPTPTATHQPLLDSTPVTAGEGEWLPVETSKSLSLEEVSLPLGQSESFVTLDEAVEMLEEHIEGESSVFTPVSSEQMLTVASDQLSSGNLTLEPPVGKIVLEALPSEVASDLDCINQSLLPHKDGAVSIQHSNIDDVPTNMSLEDYSSQQMEN